MDSHPHHKVKLLCILKVSVQTAMNINWPNATCRRKVQKVAQCLVWNGVKDLLCGDFLVRQHPEYFNILA
jgi:hypothetical protein